MKSRSHYCAVAAVIFALTTVVDAQPVSAPVEEFGAKALFYNADGRVATVASNGSDVAIAAVAAPAPVATSTAKKSSKPASSPAVLALRASVLLVAEGGGTREVKPSYGFKSGDKIKLAFTSNKSGYFYLATLGTSGKVQLLAPRKGEPAVLSAGNRYIFPASSTGYFRLDGKTGKEELWAVLSDVPLDAINMGAGQVAHLDSSQNAAPTAAVALASKATVDITDQLASKDLVFEEDGEAAYASMKPAAYLQPSNKRKPSIVVKLTLNHQ